MSWARQLRDLRCIVFYSILQCTDISQQRFFSQLISGTLQSNIVDLIDLLLEPETQP